MYQDVINILASDDYYSLKKDIYKYINDDNFIDTIVTAKDPFVFDRFVKMCEYKIDTSILYEKRNAFIRKILNTLNLENITSFFNTKNEKTINRYLTEYIIQYYFGDNYYNFLVNYNQMVSYLKCIDQELVDNNHLQIYREFKDIIYSSFNDKLAVFKLYSNDSIMDIFYDDLKTVRDHSHKLLVDKVVKLNHKSKIYNKEISEKYKIDVYILNGEPFYGFVRCLSIPRGNLFNYFDYVYSTRNRLGYSFSYISNNNIGTTDFDDKSVILYYDNIDYKNIMYVHHGDLHAKKMRIQDDYLSEKENEILTPDNLIAYTNNYNEVYIKNNKNKIVPTALICYDEITEKDTLFAHKYNLSILVINRKMYKRYVTYEDDYNLNTYRI